MESTDDDNPLSAVDKLSSRVIGAAIEVHRELGPGFPESIYENALALEFDRRGIPYEQQHRFQVLYLGRPIGEGRIDFFIGQELILEIKAIEALSKVQIGQVVSYLRAKGKPLGLLINFNVLLLKDGLKRVRL